VVGGKDAGAFPDGDLSFFNGGVDADDRVEDWEEGEKWLVEIYDGYSGVQRSMMLI
jgi:hypothetical protein